MRKLIILVLIFTIFTANWSFANSNDYRPVFEMGILGQGGLDLDRNISRAELATVAIRLSGLEYMKDSFGNKGNFKDVKGWATAYINLASSQGIMSGVSKDTFNPEGKVVYIELLTVLMRILGYEDGIDFKDFPLDYYNKALEIGIANVYIPHDEVVNRDTVAKTIDKAFGLQLKNENRTFIEKFSASQYLPIESSPITTNVNLKDIKFNTNIVGSFSGELIGRDDFTGYKIELLSKSGVVYKTATMGQSGAFNIQGFNIDVLAQLSGYSYRVYDNHGEFLFGDDLS